LKPNDSKNYTVREVAEVLNCSVAHVHHLIESGRLQAFNIAANPYGGKRGTWRISHKALRALIEREA